MGNPVDNARGYSALRVPMLPPTALSAICTPDGWKQRLGLYEYIYYSIATRTWRTNVWFGAEPLAEPAEHDVNGAHWKQVTSAPVVEAFPVV